MSDKTTWTGLPECIRVQVQNPDPMSGIESGATGTIVHCYEAGVYEIEFLTGDGKSKLATFSACDIQPMPKFVCMIQLSHCMGEGPRIWYEKFEAKKSNTFDTETSKTLPFTWDSGNHFLRPDDMVEKAIETGFYQYPFDTEDEAKAWCAGAHGLAKVLRKQLDAILTENE